MTALMHACMHGYSEIADLLLLHGANVDLHNKDNTTAIGLAARYVVDQGPLERCSARTRRSWRHGTTVAAQRCTGPFYRSTLQPSATCSVGGVRM